MSSDVKEFYGNDVIYRFDKRKRIVFGIVLDTYESTDVDDTQALKKGQIRVYWLNNAGHAEQVWKQEKVKLLSRSVVPGDIVRRLEQGKETQRGYCRSVELHAAVQIIGTNKVIDNVSQERLHFVHPFDYDTPVCIGEQFGRIDSCDFKITMSSRCGSVVEIMHDLNKGIYNGIRLYDESCLESADVYHVGQTVMIVPANLKSPKWVKKTRAMKRNQHIRQRFLVLDVEARDVVMNAHPVEGTFTYVYQVSNEDLHKMKVLKVVDENVPQLSERRLLKITSNDILMMKRDWITKQSAKFRPHNDSNKTPKCIAVVKKPQHRCAKFRTSSTFLSNLCHNLRNMEDTMKNKKDSDDSEWTTDEEEEEPQIGVSKTACTVQAVAVEALCTDSKATIIWQDGSEEKDVPTTQLYYSISLDDHEFFPGEWVVRADENVENYGVIQKVDYLERTALIKWFIFSAEDDVPAFSHQNEMSVYDIKKHPVFLFRPGSIVHRSKICEDNLGTVIDSYPHGYVRVKWLDGVEEDCWPQHIGVLPELRNMFLDESDTEDGDATMEVSWETESVESILGDMPTEFTWQNLAAKLVFIRTRIVYVKEALLRDQTREENFSILKNLLSVYDNSSYLDKLLGTSFFSVKSKHYQTLLSKIKEKAKTFGVDIRTRLPNYESMNTRSQVRIAEKENIKKIMKMEIKVEQECGQVRETETAGDAGEASTPMGDPSTPQSNINLCIELLSMLKCRMDLSYAEIVSRISGTQALSVLTKSSENATTPATSTPLPSFSTTPDVDDSFTSITNTPPRLQDMDILPDHLFSPSINSTPTLSNLSNSSSTGAGIKPFDLLDEAPNCHRFFSNKLEPVDNQRFFKSVMHETKLLKDSLPAGVWVYSFANRMDLHSVMIRGPNNTPYEDGLFLFDLQLSADYPRSPPHCIYISYNSERLNPNLYVEGRVCVSLLGTWLGRGTEIWGPNSTLLQLIVSIQGLILVSEPYYNEAGYEKQCDSQQGYENSRTYNELVLLRLVQSMTEMLEHPHEVFKEEIFKHFAENGDKMLVRMRAWITDESVKQPEFPLLPVSKGLKLSLNNALEKFQKVLDKHMQQQQVNNTI